MEFEKNSSTIQKAIPLYKYTKHKKLIIGSILFLLILLVFFLLSNIILPAKLAKKSEVTHIGSNYEFDYLRSFTVYEIAYSKSQQMLEVVMEFENENYDGIDDYFYAFSAIGSSTKNTKIDEIFHDSLITVIRITGVKPFDEAELLFAPKYGKLSEATDSQTGIITINKYNANYVDHIDTTKTKVQYLIDRIEIIIKKLEKKLNAENEKLQNLKKQITGLENENIELENNKSFLTNDEISSVDAKIIKNKEMINKTNDAIRQKERQLEELGKQLNEDKLKKEELLKS